ncbi:hypothetical protein HYDPIDRAFT_25466 [Hydnomerulius pinastri MD-312]|nr:hypothetical protein HYDPIDRAFT_25466 [Hydnomerulius pinastri MD-312]
MNGNAPTVRCLYCDALIPQPSYNAHVRTNHSPPTPQDLANFYKKYYPAQPAKKRPAAATAVAFKSPTASSSGSTLIGSTTTLSSLSAEKSTQFRAWRESDMGSTHQLPFITADDVASFRVDRSDQPQTTAQLLRSATKYNIQELVDSPQGVRLSDVDRHECHELIRTMPVFPAFSAYTLLHLKLCAPDKPRLLQSFRQKVQEWANNGDEWCLANYHVLKRDLLEFSEKSQVDHHLCKEALLDGSRVHPLDIDNLGALVVTHATDEGHAQSFYAMTGDQAQAVLNLLQALLDFKSSQLDGWYQRRLLDAVIRLSKKARLYPQSLKITGVENCTPTDRRGGFGAIFQGNLLGQVVALKELQAAGRSTDQFLRASHAAFFDFCQEAVVWRNVRHINCLPFYGIANVNDGAPRTCLVSPWMANGNLCSYLKEKPEARRLPLILDIANGIEYLHTMQPTIVHGDLKSLNVLVTSSGRACLADFGLATAYDTQAAVATTIYGVAGTNGYMAPELMEAADNLRLLPQLDRRRCDMFAFGCIVYEMYTGAPPFAENPSVRSQFIRIGERPPRPTDQHISDRGLDDDMWEFIESLWKQIPEARIVAESARAFLSYKSKTMTSQRSPSLPSADPEWDVDTLYGLVTPEGPFTLY